MVEDRSRDLALALRRNRGKALLPEWLDQFLAVTGIRLTADALLPLEVTDQLKQKLVERLQSNEVYYREWSVDLRDQLIGYLRVLARNAGSLEVVLFSKVDGFIGAARVRTDAVLREPMRVWAFVENDLTLVTDDLTSGLCVEMNYYTREGDYVKDGVYALTSWGAFASVVRNG